MTDAGTQALRVAIVIDPDQPLGLLANTVAVLAAGLGAAMPALGGRTLVDSTGRVFLNSADRPIPVLQASTGTLATTPCGARGDPLAFPLGNRRGDHAARVRRPPP